MTSPYTSPNSTIPITVGCVSMQMYFMQSYLSARLTLSYIINLRCRHNTELSSSCFLKFAPFHADQYSPSHGPAVLKNHGIQISRVDYYLINILINYLYIDSLFINWFISYSFIIYYLKYHFIIYYLKYSFIIYNLKYSFIIYYLKYSFIIYYLKYLKKNPHGIFTGGRSQCPHKSSKQRMNLSGS